MMINALAECSWKADSLKRQTQKNAKQELKQI